MSSFLASWIIQKSKTGGDLCGISVESRCHWSNKSRQSGICDFSLTGNFSDPVRLKANTSPCTLRAACRCPCDVENVFSIVNG